MRTTRTARSVSAFVLLSLSVVLLATGGSIPALAHHRTGPCDIHRTADMTIKEHSKALIRCAVARWPVKGGADKAICVARRESALNPKAVGGDGAYLGLFQHMKSAWHERFVAWTKRAWQLKDDGLNGRSNTIVTIRIANAQGWAAWKGAGC